MIFTLFIAENCTACEKVEKYLRAVLKSNSKIVLQVESIERENPKNIVIVPALFINDKLFAYGEVDSLKISRFIKSNLI